MLNWRHFDGDLDYFLDDFLDDLRHFDDPLDYSRYYDYLLHYPLDFHALRYLHDLLDDLLLDGWHLLDLLEVYLLRDDLLLAD